MISPADVLVCGTRCLDISVPHVMGVLNVTPDSFSDGGRFNSPMAAVDQACRWVEEGASLIDVGGESTRPGASPVPESQELDRVIPVIEAITARLDVIVSVDTSTPAVMREAAQAGAGLLNDVRALRRPGAMEAALSCGLPVCLMHMQGEPATMQLAPCYDDVVRDVMNFLSDRVSALTLAGFDRSRILLDPGFGFGKTVAQNYTLLKSLPTLAGLGFPLLVGLSRKSMIGEATGRSLADRLHGSVAAALLAVERGARIVRVHDVAATVDALNVYRMIR